VAILARMWSLPAVVGLGDTVMQVEQGTILALDGEAGTVELDPPAEVVEAYREREERRAVRLEEALRQIQQPAVTQDGQQVEVVANAGDVESAREALEQGAEGIGLLRTEFLYLERSTLPDEEEQVEVYRAIAQVMGSRPVIIRTLDAGGDKPLPAIPRPAEENPALGMRAIRLSQLYPDLLRTQLRAILRAGVGHNLKVMFPLVTTREELRWAKSLLHQAQEELAREGTEHVEGLEVGIMVETPAAAMMADLLAPEVDFMSIGSNDLTQYTLAADRGSQQLGSLYSALNPAVLRLIARTIEAGHTAGKWVGVCGEMAGRRLAIPILLGMGLDEFSMTPQAIPLAKQRIRSLSMAHAQEIAAHVLTLATAAEVEAYVNAQLESVE
jgi:phosphoenolpyruvate-protein phosphotransferase